MAIFLAQSHYRLQTLLRKNQDSLLQCLVLRIEVSVQPGQTVKAGEKLLVIEAMKMEHSLLAPHDGKIKEIFYKPSDPVNEGTPLITFQQ